MAPKWRLECINDFIEPGGLINFYEEWEAIQNDSARRGVGKLFIWCFNLCDKNRFYEENHLTTSSTTVNNHSLENEEITTTTKDIITRQSLQEVRRMRKATSDEPNDNDIQAPSNSPALLALE